MRLIDADETIKWERYGNTRPIEYRTYAINVLASAPPPSKQNPCGMGSGCLIHLINTGNVRCA